MLRAPHHLCGPPQDSLKKFIVFLELRNLDLDTVLQMCPHQGRVEGKNHLPQPASHALFNTPQNTIRLLYHTGMLLLHTTVVCMRVNVDVHGSLGYVPCLTTGWTWKHESCSCIQWWWQRHPGLQWELQWLGSSGQEAVIESLSSGASQRQHP